MASKHPKVETFATLSAENAEYRRVFPIMQAQAQQAMLMAAQEKGKYLHVLKLFAAVLEQNMQKGIETVVLHKTLTDQPDTINISRNPSTVEANGEQIEVGYSYRVVTQEEIEALNGAVGTADEAAGAEGTVASTEPSGECPVEAPAPDAT